MSAKEEKRKEAFRHVDKPGWDGHMDEEMSGELREKGDEHSEVIRQKGTEAREVIDSQNYGRRKGHKGLNSPK